MNSQYDLAIEQTLPLCKRFEGFKSKPYLCPAGIPTIGYGSTFYPNGLKVTLKDLPISEEIAFQMLKYQVEHVFLPGVLRMCPDVTDYRLAALIDFAFNLGLTRLKGSTLRTKVNAKDWKAAASELRKWTRGGGKILPGLVIRREVEAALIQRDNDLK
jgi:lysozyme